MSENKVSQQIEDVAVSSLDGDMKKNTLEFVEYLKENELSVLQENAMAVIIRPYIIFN